MRNWKPLFLALVWIVSIGVAVLMARSIQTDMNTSIRDIVLYSVIAVLFIAAASFITLLWGTKKRSLSHGSLRRMGFIAMMFAIMMTIIYFMGRVHSWMQHAGAEHQLLKVSNGILLYSLLGMLIGVCVEMKKATALWKDRHKVKLNGWILLAAVLMYASLIYRSLYPAIVMEYGFVEEGIRGFLMDLTRTNELGLVLSVLAGIFLVRGISVEK
ncbi:hypothetical protein [Marinicrinis lubricantis]|uniref:Uncharacterized protein n=1 Tax=Marinicrinis lubricantis TaxID=2086470 RepID=A0ABW1ING9_9BACL